MEEEVALDTNRYRDLADGVAEVVKIVEEAESVAMPFVVLAELRAGFSIGLRGAENERSLLRFLQKPGISTLFPTDATTRAYAGLFRQLKAQGTPIPSNVLWIASLVVEHDLTLFSRDHHFQSLPQIRMI